LGNGSFPEVFLSIFVAGETTDPTV